MQQHTYTEQEAAERGYSHDEYTEIVRRAQQIRQEKEGQLSRDLLVESAAEVGIREEDLREAERQLAEEKERSRLAEAERKKQQGVRRLVAAAVAGFLGLTLIFSYNGLNSERA